MPILFRIASVDDRQAQGPWGNIRSGHGHGQGADLSGQIGTVRRGLFPGGRGQRLKRRAALHRVSLPAVQDLREPLLCGGLHPWKAGISPGDRLGGGAGRLPSLGALWNLLREHEIENERPLPGKTRQRHFCAPQPGTGRITHSHLFRAKKSVSVGFFPPEKGSDQGRSEGVKEKQEKSIGRVSTRKE